MATAWLDAHALLRHCASGPIGDRRLDGLGASPDTQSAQRRQPLDDLDDALDDLDDLDDREEAEEPSLHDLDDEDEMEPFDPGDDSDLGLDDSEDENIGLDTSVGFDETPDDLDLPELGEEEDTWDETTDDADDVDDDLPEAELEAEEEEEGWINDDDDEVSGLDDDDLDDDIEEEPEGSGDDGGAEGLEDDSDIEELDLTALPALDINAEEEVGLPGLDGTDDLVGFGLLDEPVVEIAPGQTWKMLRTRTTRITRIAWPPGSGVAGGDGMLDTRSLATRGQTLYLASAGLYCLEPQVDTFSALPLREAIAGAVGDRSAAIYARSVMLAEHEGALQLAVIADGQLHFSSDEGQSFSVQESPKVTHAGFTHSAAGLRLWWSTVEGALGSDSGTVVLPQTLAGKTGHLLVLHADGRRSISWLEQRDGKLQLVASADGGKSFVTWRTPLAAAEAAPQLEACGPAVLLAASGEPRCAVQGTELEPIAAGVRKPVTLADEEGEPFVFGCVERGDECLLIRRSALADRATPLVLACIGRGDLGDPLALAVGYGEDGMLSVFLAGTQALVRVEASLDGEEIA